MSSSERSRAHLPPVVMSRRRHLQALAGASGTLVFGWPARQATAARPEHGLGISRVAAAWRQTGEDGRQRDQVGILQLDWQRRKLSVEASHLLTRRAHGITPNPQGGYLVVDSRPGTLLLRFDAGGHLAHTHALADEKPYRTLGGHAVYSADGKWVLTSETDALTGEGWIGVRHAGTLVRTASWRSHGLDPHQMVLTQDGHLLVANGGIPRDSKGNKRQLADMDSSLVLLHGQTGEKLGQWWLEDKRLSLRHLAWGQQFERDGAPGSRPVQYLGIGLQAEHDDLAQRRSAPSLAVWDGHALVLPTRSPLAGGYAGDIAAGPAGGFVMSGQRVNRNALWHPDDPDHLIHLADLTEPCAMASWSPGGAEGGLLMGAGLAVMRWHPRHPAAALAVPAGMVLDNHWIVLS